MHSVDGPVRDALAVVGLEPSRAAAGLDAGILVASVLDDKESQMQHWFFLTGATPS